MAKTSDNPEPGAFRVDDAAHGEASMGGAARDDVPRDDAADADSTKTSSRDDRATVTQPRLGFLGGLRWFWRQLTSMRTALFLLLLVAVGAVPGSIFPQHSIDEQRVTQYRLDHPDLAPWLDRLGMFNVYSSPWFAAIYLLLTVSLVGCIIPRVRVHYKAMRQGPPAMPRRLSRLPAHREVTLEATPEQVIAATRTVLRRKRFALRKGTGEFEVASEGGMLRETGNLLFHLSLIGIIVSVAAGHVWGWRGDVIVPEGSGFASTPSRYDTLKLGPWVDAEQDIPDWALKMNTLKVMFESNVDPTSSQWGQPRDFTADVDYRESANSAWKKDTIKVNHPLKVGGGEVYLLGNGYAPKITFKDAKGNVLYDESTPFLSIDNKYKSTGAFKISGASPKQIGLTGFFLPTAYLDPNPAQLGLPRRQGAGAVPHGVHGRPVPERSPAVGVQPRHRHDDAAQGREGPAGASAARPRPDGAAAEQPRLRDVRRGATVGGAVDPSRPRQGAGPAVQRPRTRRPRAFADDPSSARVRPRPSRYGW